MRACARGLSAKSRATAFKASSTGIFPSVVLGMMLRWHCETTQECERPIILANSRIPAVFSDIRSSSKHKQKPSDKPLFSGQTTFSKPITRRPSGLASTRSIGSPFPVPRPLRLPASFTLNAFAQICAKVRKWGFPYVSRVRARSNAPFPQQRHHLHDVQTHCATTPTPFGASAKNSTNCTRET